MLELLTVAALPKTSTAVQILTEQKIVEQEPVTKKHIVQEDETLEKIAKAHSVDWKRLYDKNTDIEHQDELVVGQEIIIPEDTEELTERPLAVEVVQTITSEPKQAVEAVVAPQVPATVHAGPGAGWYPAGQCTHYVWSKRPVGFWNNASEWYWQAQRDGWSTGLTPRAGAIGVQIGVNHVVLIERVDGDRVYISERNYDYRGSYRERWASASDFRYIY